MHREQLKKKGQKISIFGDFTFASNTPSLTAAEAVVEAEVEAAAMFCVLLKTAQWLSILSVSEPRKLRK